MRRAKVRAASAERDFLNGAFASSLRTWLASSAIDIVRRLEFTAVARNVAIVAR